MFNLGKGVYMNVGRKDDSAKVDVTLLFDDCPDALRAVAEVLDWAVTRKLPVPYKRGSWKYVESSRYRAARGRHSLAMGGDDTKADPETGLLELAHIATNALLELQLVLAKRELRISDPVELPLLYPTVGLV
jgi:hypothetical protein